MARARHALNCYQTASLSRGHPVPGHGQARPVAAWGRGGRCCPACPMSTSIMIRCPEAKRVLYTSGRQGNNAWQPHPYRRRTVIMSRLLSARPTCPATRFSAALPALASRRSSSTMNPRLSPGTDAETVAPALSALLSSHGGRWALASDGQALERSFKFKTFEKTWVQMLSPRSTL